MGRDNETKADTSQGDNGLSIRDLRRGDVEGLLRCLRRSFVEEFEVNGLDSDYWRKILRRRFNFSGKVGFGLLRLLKREPLELFVADVNGTVAGAIIASFGGKIGIINQVMVHPDFRRKGIGTKLMNATLNYMKKRRLTRALLHVGPDNIPAKALYSKFGFQKFGDTVWLTARIDSLPGSTKVEKAQIRGFDEKTDLDAVYELMKSSQGSTRFKIYDYKKKDLKTSLMKRVTRFSSDQKTVAIRDGRVVGYVRSIYTQAKKAGTIRLYVPSETLLEETVENLVQAGLDTFRSRGTKTVLTTIPSTRQELIQILKRMGFEERLTQEGRALEFQ